jgi:hypothetical protein
MDNAKFVMMTISGWMMTKNSVLLGTLKDANGTILFWNAWYVTMIISWNQKASVRSTPSI